MFLLRRIVVKNETKKNLNVVIFVADVPENYKFDKKLKDVWNFDVLKMLKVIIYTHTYIYE